MLIAEGLVKRYGSRHALDGFDLAVPADEIVGLIGHNGAGKTTFVEIVAGLVRPDAGRISVAALDVLREGRAARRLLGVAPQELALYGSATVRENLRLFAGLAGLRGRRGVAEIAQVLDELCLTAVADRPVVALSGGQRRRVQAATAMVGSPPLLLLDEPTMRRRSGNPLGPVERGPGSGRSGRGRRLHDPLPAGTRRSRRHTGTRAGRTDHRARHAGRAHPPPARRTQSHLRRRGRTRTAPGDHGPRCRSGGPARVRSYPCVRRRAPPRAGRSLPVHGRRGDRDVDGGP